MFDAYTVKKVLPRLVIAAILIQLSWPLFTILIEVVNQIAWGVEGIMYAPFGGRDELGIGNLLEGATGNRGFFLLFVGLLVSAGGIGAFGALTLAIGAILALVIAFFVLAIRQVVIIVLLVTAPLALAAWILPNTEKFFKIWWESFSKLLLMYPLILLLIAGGRVAAKLAADTQGIDTNNELFRSVIVLLAFFGPFFLIPATFKVAGSAFANIAGITNDKTKGVFDGLRNARQKNRAKKWGDRYQRADESRLFNPEGKLRGLNTLASAAVDPITYGKMLAGTKGGKAAMSEIAQERWAGTEKLAGAISKAGLNDRALGALTYWDGSKDHLEQLATQLESKKWDPDKINEQGGKGDWVEPDANDILGAQQLRGNTGFLYSAYRSDEYGRGDINAAAGLASAAQGFTSGDEISRVAAGLDKKYKGMGIGNTYKTQAELAGARSGALTKPGYTSVLDDDGNWTGPNYTDTKGAAYKQLAKIGVQDIGASKGLFGRTYTDHVTGKKVKVGSTVGQGMTTMLKNGGDDARELESTLVTAYHSYNNPTIRKHIRQVFSDAYGGGEAGAAAAESILNRSGGSNTNLNAEQARANQGQEEQQPPFGGEPPNI